MAKRPRPQVIAPVFLNDHSNKYNPFGGPKVKEGALPRRHQTKTQAEIIRAMHRAAPLRARVKCPDCHAAFHSVRNLAHHRNRKCPARAEARPQVKAHSMGRDSTEEQSQADPQAADRASAVDDLLARVSARIASQWTCEVCMWPRSAPVTTRVVGPSGKGPRACGECAELLVRALPGLVKLKQLVGGRAGG